MIEVPLSQGLVALVDDEDADLVLSAGKWHAVRKDGLAYAARGVRRPDGLRRVQRLHTFLTGWPLVDHIDGDGLNNRRANLRPATTAQNLRNRGPQRDNTSGFKGVAWHRTTGKWQAKIKTDGRWRWLGLHSDAESAARAYDAAAVELHAEFARLNFPEEATA